MDVKLIAITPDPEDLIANAARICYASTPKGEQANKKLVSDLRDWGHLSTYEHSSATFRIEGISRACTHQLVRHRLASYSQQSQRYVNEQGFEYITPPKIEGDESAHGIYVDFIKSSKETYEKLIESGIPKEDARFVLPNACETKIIVTMNFRELRHFIKLRREKSAQWEIRELAEKMLGVLKEKAPNAFADL